MLESTKRIYEQEASLIPNWKEMDRNELCRKYIENEHDRQLASAYFSAIVLTYWGKLNKKEIPRKETGLYDLLIDAIMLALKNRAWEREDSTIYRDPNGPDKAINRIFKTRLINERIKSQAQKYYADTSSLSLNELLEKTDGYLDMGEEDESNEMCLSIDISDFVKINFKYKDYFMSFIIHIVAYENCIEDRNGQKQVSIKKICGCIHHMDDHFYSRFSEEYGVDVDKVKKAAEYFIKLPTDVLTEKIKWYFRQLRHYNIFMKKSDK